MNHRRPADSLNPASWPKIRYQFLKFLDEEFPFRPRADAAYITPQDVEKLGKFIQTPLAQDPSHPGDPGIIYEAHWGPSRFGILPHGAKFENLKGLAILTQSILPEKYRAGAVQFNGHANEDQKQGKVMTRP